MVEKIWTVGELNNCIGNIIDDMSVMIWLTGEVTEVRKYGNSVFVTLRDFELSEKNIILAVQWGSDSGITWDSIPKNSKLELFGRVRSYKSQGKYQFQIQRVRVAGEGEIYKQLEQLKEKLRKEGLFDKSKKKKIPEFPRKIGIITSLEGAAIRDFLKIINNKFPRVNVIICPSLVQGSKAEDDVVESIFAFERLSVVKRPDVLIIMRGGGLIEDLWTFNSEKVARKVFDCLIPTISAIGHEIDYTICDFVADVRAPTPTAAAEIVVKNELELAKDISNKIKTIRMLLDSEIKTDVNQLSLAIGKLENIKYCVLNKYRTIQELSVRVDESVKKFGLHRYKNIIDILLNKLNNRVREYLFSNREKISILIEKLKALEFRNVLNRGYSVLTNNKNGKIISSVDDVKLKDSVNAVLKDGILILECIKKD